MASDHSSRVLSDGSPTPSLRLEVEAPALGRAIRDQRALPLSEAEADALASSLEDSGSDEELLANTLTAVQLLLDRLGAPGEGQRG